MPAILWIDTTHMVFGFEKTIYDAVLFLEENSVIKEMLLPEFEAVLDGIVGEPELADKSCQAVFLKVDRRLQIIGAVFFTIDFDEEGNADPRWNLPLNQLVDTAAYGAELHGQKVRIACNSQCQIPWHQESLWEPDLSVNSNTLKVLDAAIKANKLGLLVEESDAAEQSPSTADDSGEPAAQAAADKDSSSAAEDRLRMAQHIKKQRRYIASLKSSQKIELERQHAQFNSKAEQLLTDVTSLRRQLEEVQDQYQTTVLDLEAARAEQVSQRENFEQQFSDVANQHGVNHRALEDKYRKDFQRRLIEETSAVKEKLEMREVEVFYREEQITRLNKEVEELQSIIGRLQDRDLDNEIKALVAHGVHFVLTEPGLGPMSIDAKDLLRFNENPRAYMAERAGVETAQYAAWRDHVLEPVCQSVLSSGQVCGCSIDAVATPDNFSIGHSDRCAAHQTVDRVAATGS